MWRKYIYNDGFASAEPKLASHLSYWHINNNGIVALKQLEHNHPSISNEEINQYNKSNKQWEKDAKKQSRTCEKDAKKQSRIGEFRRCNYCGYPGDGMLEISISADDLTRSNKSIPVAMFCYICALRFFGNVEYISRSEGVEYFVTPNLGIKKAHEERLRRSDAEDYQIPNHRILFKKIGVDIGKQCMLTDDGKIEYSQQTISKLVRVSMLCCSCNSVIRQNDALIIGEDELQVTYYKLNASWGYTTDFDLEEWNAWLCIDCGERMLHDAMKDVKPHKYVSSLQHFFGKTFFPNYKDNSHTVHMQKFYDSVWNKIFDKFEIKIERHKFPYGDRPCYSYRNQKYMNLLNEYDEAKYLNSKNSKHELNWMVLAKRNIEISAVVEYIREMLVHENLDKDYLEALNKPETQEDILAEKRSAELIAENIRKKRMEENEAFLNSLPKINSPRKKKRNKLQKQKKAHKNIITVECNNMFSVLDMDD